MQDNKPANYLSCIAAAAEKTVGKIRFTEDSFFKKDLGFTSIDLIDFFFELERAAGKKLNGRQILLSLSTEEGGFGDLSVRSLIEHLSKADSKP